MKFDFASLTVPVIQAPMAGGVNTPALAAAVANAGGVGSFGFAYSSPQKIKDDLFAVKALTSGPINANFFIFQDVSLPGQAEQLNCIRSLSHFPLQGEYALTIPKAPFFPDLEQQLEPIWALCPEILTFHFGIPHASVMERARSLGIAVGITATSVDEAEKIEKAAADFIVAQGVEAGGHRGMFNAGAPDLDLPIEKLTSLITKKCALPVVASGAIMTGGDIRKALSWGAVAVQMGTAFLCCDESGASPAHKDYLLHQQDRGTAFTSCFSGRPARGIKNRFMALTESSPFLPFPIQNSLTGPLRQLALKLGDGEFQSLWAGSAYYRSRKMPASQLMKILSDALSI
jgi:nitronate monooxygenase